MAKPVAISHAFRYEDYLAFEEGSNTRHEYHAGEIYAMASGSIGHAALASVMHMLMGDALRTSGRDCRVFGRDLRVQLASAGLETYPDVSVVCGELKFPQATRQAVTNPTVLVEVLSPSTEAYDRCAKREHYQTIESLEAYGLVAQAVPLISVWCRTAMASPSSLSVDVWSHQATGSGQSFSIPGFIPPTEERGIYEQARIALDGTV